MAKHRCFYADFFQDDNFLNLPHSAQMLYVHLNLNADDDGFVNNPKTIMRISNTNDNDFALLVENGYIYTFSSGVIVVSHWLQHNSIQPSKKTNTVYQNELAELEKDQTKRYILIQWRTKGGQIPPQDNISKDNLIKDNTIKDNISKENARKESAERETSNILIDDEFRALIQRNDTSICKVGC